MTLEPVNPFVNNINVKTGQWIELLPGLRAVFSPGYILVLTDEPWQAVSSGIIGGGMGLRRCFLNRQVDENYSEADPVAETSAFLSARFGEGKDSSSTRQDFPDRVVLLTAARVDDAAWIRLSLAKCEVALIVTAGVNNACTAGVTPCLRIDGESPEPGTINVMAFLSRPLAPGALVNAVQTVAEAKAQVLQEIGVVCPDTKVAASGTSTDAVVIAAPAGSTSVKAAGAAPVSPIKQSPYDTGKAEEIIQYAGPLTPAGYLLALGLRLALPPAVRRYWDWKEKQRLSEKK